MIKMTSMILSQFSALSEPTALSSPLPAATCSSWPSPPPTASSAPPGGVAALSGTCCTPL